MTTLQDFSDQLAAAVEQVAPALVTVDARGRQTATGLVWSANGDILTADHVLQRDDIYVYTHDGHKHTATVVGRDPSSDLALLNIAASGLAVPTLADLPKVGHLVLAVGRPDDVQATLGSVVALGGPVRGAYRYLDAYIQTDVTMYPGFSGGPLLAANGQVLGLNSSALARGASLAVPVSNLRSVADQLRQHGRIQRGYLGVGTQPVKLAADVAHTLNQRIGLMVINVEANSPADQAGLKQGDVLVRLGDHTLSDIEALQAALGPAAVGQTVPAHVVRGGTLTTLKLTIGARE